MASRDALIRNHVARARVTNKPFVIKKSVFSPLECMAILDSSFFNIRYYRADSKRLDRRVDIAYLSRQAAPEIFFEIENLARRKNIWNLIISGITDNIRIQRYGRGGYSNTHTDYDYADGDFSKLTIIIPLVDRSSWEGGDLTIGNNLLVPKIGIGDAVIFPSFLPHSVTHVERGNRIIMSAWISGPPIR